MAKIRTESIRQRRDKKRQAARDRRAFNANYIYNTKRRYCYNSAIKKEIRAENVSGKAFLGYDAWKRIMEKLAEFDAKKDEIMNKIKEEIKTRIIQRQDWTRLKREYGEDPPEISQGSTQEGCIRMESWRASGETNSKATARRNSKNKFNKDAEQGKIPAKSGKKRTKSGGKRTKSVEKWNVTRCHLNWQCHVIRRRRSNTKRKSRQIPQGSEKMNRVLLQNTNFQNDSGLIQKFQQSSIVEVGTEHIKKSICTRAQEEESQSMIERRILRSQYRCLKSSIAEEQEEILNTQSNKFDSVFSEVQNLHNQVCRPREQVADAEALLNITSALLASVKSTQSSNGISLADFVSALAIRYSDKENDNKTHISWATLGLEASSIFSNASGASTMIGPIYNEPRQRRVSSIRKHSKPTESTRPETVADSGDHKSETDKNMATMFNILKRHKHARLEALVLNRQSFSQTVENIFALSFLVKDGRVEINLDEENKNHIVFPKNAPTAKELASGETSYSQFVFRFDFKDWEFMMESVETGQELMPHRKSFSSLVRSKNSPSTPIRKISRNRGLEAPLTLNAQDANQCGSVSDEEEEFSQRPAKRIKLLL